MDWQTIRKALEEPIPQSEIKTRKQAGITLSYLEGWRAMAIADEIFGPENWSRETLEIRKAAERERPIGRDQKPGWSVTCVARVRITVGEPGSGAFVVRDGTGAGHGIGMDLGECYESAVKEAETDATKRALMTFGWRIGRALYDPSREHVDDATAQPSSPQPQDTAAPATGTITQAQFLLLRERLEASGADEAKFLEYYEAPSLEEFPSARFDEAIRKLNKKIAARAAGAVKVTGNE